MNYYSLVLSHFSRIFVRKNSGISVVNVLLTLLLLIVWIIICWGVRADYSGDAFLAFSSLATCAVVVALTAFSQPSTGWRNYFSNSTNAWLRSSPAIIVGGVISLSTLLPFYLANIDRSEWTVIILRTLIIIVTTFHVTLIGAAFGEKIRKFTQPGLIRLFAFLLAVLLLFSVSTAPVVLVAHLVLVGRSINLLIVLLLAVVGLLGFSLALFEWVATLRENRSTVTQYSGLFRSFRVFGTSADRFSVQLTNSILRWVRSNTISHRVIVMLVIVYLIEQLAQFSSIDTRSTLLLIGVSVCAMTATISYSAVAQSRFHLYLWLPLSTRSTIITNWLSGVLAYSCVMSVIIWIAPFFDYWSASMLIASVLTVHSATSLVAYRLSQAHLQQGDRLAPIVIGSAVFGTIPGIYFNVVPNDIALGIVIAWLAVAVIWLSLSNRQFAFQTSN